MSSENPTSHPINVRALAEFALEGGDLAMDRQLMDRMQDGIKGHQTVQGGYPAGYKSEVAVRLDCEVDGIALCVRGRIDGLLMADGEWPLVDEIKTTQRDVQAISEDDYPVHWAQAEMYAHMVCEKHGLPGARVRLTYYNLSGAMARFERGFDAAVLAVKFLAYARPYARWLRAVGEWIGRSRPTITALGFPFDGYRSGQREMAANAFYALREGKCLLAEAPTGIGKTAAALFPALKALGEGLVDKAFYLTARTTTRAVAEGTLERMRGRGLVLRSVTLTAKEKLCLRPGERCSPETCDRARGYYDRRRAALYEGLSMERLARPDIEALAERHGLCPFELSLDLSEIADVIICDYNHAFDPRVRLKRFFLDGGDYALLIDEAHNLPDRVRAMLSAELNQRDFESLRREVGKLIGRKGLYRALGALIRAFKAIREAHDEPEMELSPPEALEVALGRFTEAAQRVFDDDGPHLPALTDGYFAALSYLRALELYGDSYRTLIAPHGKSAVSVKLWCYDAAPYLAGCYKGVRGCVLFSATLSPMRHYFDACGLSEDRGDAMLSLPSPFPEENLLVLRLPIQTRYAMRDRTLPDVARALLSMCAAKPGNYLACFPSHAYLQKVKEMLEADGSVRLLVQQGQMDDAARAAFLDQFEEGPSRSMLALIAMGGIFAEGVDLPGERLSGAAIVGVGIPQISFEREKMRELLDDAGDGYHYAYTYPGLERVLQAAGRVIRTDRDRGVVLLIDDRFAREEYRPLLPEHWQVRPARTVHEMDALLTKFWATSALPST